MPEARELIVINTGPLVSLGRADLLDLVGGLSLRFVTPAAVAEEIAAGVAAGHPVEVPSWVRVEDLVLPATAVAIQALDRGEAAVIQRRPGQAPRGGARMGSSHPEDLLPAAQKVSQLAREWGPKPASGDAESDTARPDNEPGRAVSD